MPPKNSGGSTKFPGGHKVIHRTPQTAFVRVVTPRELPVSLIKKIVSHVSPRLKFTITLNIIAKNYFQLNCPRKFSVA